MSRSPDTCAGVGGIRAVLLLSCFLATPALGQERDYPILDVHVHAHRSPQPRAYCALSGLIGVTDVDGEPICEAPLEPEADGPDLMARTLAYLDSYDMYAVAMTQDFSQLESWMAASDRVFPSIQTGVTDFESNNVGILSPTGGCERTDG